MIIITMAGLSSRFFKAGYKKPKYALELCGKTLFEWSVKSFINFFEIEYFLFVVRPDDFAESFVINEVKKLGIKNYGIFRLNSDTRGQAETAYLALKPYEKDFPITIFNIDTIRYNYEEPNFISDCDGYLEVFLGEGEHWSFVEPGPSQSVIRTTEKQRISNLCSDGLYFFKSQLQFRKIFEQAVESHDQVKGEFYIAPLYNRIINQGGVVKYNIIGCHQIDFCGTPDEYENLLREK